MDIREKLVELLCESIHRMWLDYPQAADYLIANGVTVQEWIPVTERLPVGANGKDLCETVLAYLNNGEADGQVCVGWLNGDKWYLTLPDDDEYTVWGFGAVTHWMPLPPAPKGVSDDVENL